MTDKIKEALSHVDLFHNIPAAVIDQIASFSLIRTIRKGETIFCQGEPSPYCFGVVQGEVIIQEAPTDPRFPSKRLGVITPGLVFGESALFQDSPRSAMAMAGQDGQLIAITGAKFRAWLDRDKAESFPVLLGLFKNTLGRLGQTSHELSAVFGLGRILGSSKPFEQKLMEAGEFLRASLRGVHEVVLYSKSPYWTEFDPLLKLTPIPKIAPIPYKKEFAWQAIQSANAFRIEPKDVASWGFPEEWQRRAAIACVPLLDVWNTEEPLQGFLVVVSHEDPNAFSSNLLYLLMTVAQPLIELLIRHSQVQDLSQQQRLQQARISRPSGSF